MRFLRISIGLLILINMVLWGSITMLFNNDPPPVEHYVDNTGGSNANSCTDARSPGSAKATIGGIAGGISCLDPGEILTIRAGTYAENDLGLSAPTVPSGISDEVRTVIRGMAGETVTIQPTSASTTAVTIYGKQFITIENIIFNCNSTGGHCISLGRANTSSTPSNDITLDSIEVFGAADTTASGSSGISLGSNQNTLTTNCNMIVRNAQVHNNGGDNHGHGIYGHCRNMLVEGGSYYSNGGHGIHFYCHGSETGGNAWTGCSNSRVIGVEARNNGSAGIGLYNGTNLEAYNNVIRNNTGAGVAVRFGCNQCKVYNNTFYSNGAVGGIQVTQSAAGNNSSTGVVLRNNILFQNDGVELSDDGIGTIVSNHLCETGCYVNETSASNIFTSLAGNDFTLVPTSPAINNGCNPCNPTLPFTTDYTESNRSVPYDIGAYEFTSPLIETLTLSTPNGSNQWVKTTQQTITWASSNLSDVIIKADRGNDGVYEETVIASTPSDGFYNWTPGGSASSTVKLQICDVVDNDPCDVSDAVFTILDTAGASLTKIISENTTGSFIGDIPGVEETSIWSDQATSNFQNSSLNMNKTATITNNTLLRFTGLSQIPSAATVTSVTVGLNLSGQSGGGTGIFDLRKMLRAWIESQATYNIYSTGNNWATAGGTGAGTDRRLVAVGQLTGVGTTLQFYTVTDSVGAAGGLLALVREWVDGSDVNNGFHIERNGAGADGRLWTWTASEGTNGSRPYMSITYTVVVGTITVTQPFSNDQFYPNETVPVRWQTSNVSGGLNLYLSRDGGNNYMETLATDFPYTGVDFAWTVTTGTCAACRIKVESMNDPTVVGLSAPFRVRGTSLRLK